MADQHRKPFNNNTGTQPFKFEIEGQLFEGTITPSGKPPAFGMPNAFIVRIPGNPPANISIYMGKWIMQGNEAFVKALGFWIEERYK